MSLDKVNILEMALKIIPKQKFIYSKFKSREINKVGVYQNSYEGPEDKYGSIQAVESSLYEKLGLDLENNYRMVFSSVNMQGVDTQEAPDILEFEGKKWQVIKVIPWYTYNNWNGVLVVEDKPNDEDLPDD